MESRAKPRCGRWWKRLLLASLALCATLLVSRALLLFADRSGWLKPLGVPFDRPPHFKPLLDSAARPQLDAATGEPLYAIVPAAGHHHGEPGFGRHALTRSKAAGSFRILSIGESTTFGAGYDPALNPAGPTASYSRFLEERLRSGYGRMVEVVNCGRNGYDSHDWASLAAELDAFVPDLLVLYVGHNELKVPNLLGVIEPAVARISRSRLLQRLFGAPQREFIAPPSLLVGPVLSAEQRRFAGALFADGVDALLDAAQTCGIPALVCLPASNVLDHRPRCSIIAAGADAEARQATVAAAGREWEDGALPDLAAAGADSSARGAARATLAAIDDLLQREPAAAILHFRRGRLLLALGDRDGAAAAIQRSQELDDLPERASPDLVALLRQRADAFHVSTVDVAARFERESERGIAGDDLFYDYCHPRLFGHWLIADELLQAIIAARWIAAPAEFHAEREPGAANATPAQRYAAWCERLDINERQSATAVLAQARGYATQLGTRPEVPSAADLANLGEYVDAALGMEPALRSDPFVTVLRALLAAACGERRGARSILEQSSERATAEITAIGALVRGLPGWIAALRSAGIEIAADGRFTWDGE